MGRVLSTVATGVGVVACFYAVLLPGPLSRRAGAGLAAAALGMAVFLGGMWLCNWPLQAGYLQPATALGLVTVFLTVDLPTRLVARLTGADFSVARGVGLTGMVVACFVAAWVAGMPEVAPAGARPGLESEVGHGGP